MAKKSALSARCKFIGRFPGDGKTTASFVAQVPPNAAVLMSAPLVRSFRSVMAEQWPDKAVRPVLKQLVITINFPKS